MGIKDILIKTEFFNGLTDREVEYIVENSIKKATNKGAIIHSSSDVCRFITVVLKGVIYSSNYSINGKEQIVCSFKSSQVFGFPVVFGELTYPENIIAETDCELLYISRETLLHLFDNKAFLMSFIKKLSNKIKDFSELVEILSYTTVRERVGKHLIRLVQEYNSQDINLKKSKTRLAKEFGTSRVVVSRTFKALEDENIIKRNDDTHITILDIEALELFS